MILDELSLNWVIWWGLVAAAVLASIAAAIARRKPVMFSELSAQMREMGTELERLTTRVADLELMLSDYRVGTAKLSAQIKDLGHEPVWRPQVMIMAPGVRRTLLHNVIADAFNLDEMNDLAMAAGIEGESFSGTTRAARALSLVDYADRHGMLSELLDQCRKMRPRTNWPAEI